MNHSSENILKTFALDHIGIAVKDLETGSLPYTTIGLQQLGNDELVAGQNVLVRAFVAGDSLIELLAPTSSESAIAQYLEKRGPGIHHLALRVEHLEKEILRLEQSGANFINTIPRPGRAGTRVVFLHPRWGNGVLIELVEHATHT